MTTEHADEVVRSDIPVGSALARLRRHIGLTGQEVGRRTEMSQAKISKIETGAITPSPDDVERLASALGASTATIEGLKRQAERDRDRMADWRTGRRSDPAVWQREIAELEAGARELRIFQPALISGLLQTSEYARSVLVAVQEAWSRLAKRPPSGVASAVSARVRRQQILDDTDKQFHFVLSETVLQNLIGRADDMPSQLRRIREVADQDNVILSMIPEGARWPYPPFHGFTLLDEEHVIIDLFNTMVVTRGRSDVRLFSHVFEEMERRATLDIDPILDKYHRRYLRLAGGSE